MQRERRRDPYPWSWEVPLAVLLTVAVVVLAGIQLGRSAANLVAGAGWTWPDTITSAGTGTAGGMGSPFGTAFWSSLPGVAGGDSAAGLGAPAPSGLAGPGLLWVSVAVTEAALVAVTAWAGLTVHRRWGPGRMLGMATPAEAERLLGVTRLRKAAPIVRPDLYRKHPLPGRSVPPGHRGVPGGVEPAGGRVGRGRSSPWLRAARRARRAEEGQR